MPRRFLLYRRLLHLYPAPYRERYGGQMIQTVSDMLEDTDSPSQRALVWAKVAFDFPLSLIKTQLQYAGGIIHNQTPSYIKQSGIFTSLLVLPFFCGLVANGFDRVFFGRDLYNSWLWRMPVLGLWVLWLPVTALTIALLSYGVYTFRPERKNETNWLRRALDVTHAWPVMLPGAMAFGILFILVFHDSAHCWVQNPIHFVTRYHQTLYCTEHGSFGG